MYKQIALLPNADTAQELLSVLTIAFASLSPSFQPKALRSLSLGSKDSLLGLLADIHSTTTDITQEKWQKIIQLLLTKKQNLSEFKDIVAGISICFATYIKNHGGTPTYCSGIVDPYLENNTSKSQALNAALNALRQIEI